MKTNGAGRRPTGAANRGLRIIHTAQPGGGDDTTARLQAVGLLAAGVAHDLNNLLGVILGYCEELSQQGSMPLAAHTVVAEIGNAGSAARKLARGLLAFSSGALSQVEVVDLNEAVRRMGPTLVRMIGKRVTWSERLGENLGRIAVVPGQLEQILINLAANARDAMSNGGTLTIETANAYLDEAYARQHPGVPPGSYVRLSVSDSGCGMDVETQSRIFEPFYTTKQQGLGTGLGLATVASVVKSNSGHIAVLSRPGSGTTFHIHFPRTEQPERAGCSSTAADSASNATGYSCAGTPTILVVEDCASLRMLTRHILEDAGYRVLDAGDAGEAMARAQASASAIQLLITDVTLPGLSGAELAQRLSAVQREMSVLLMSGHCDGKQRAALSPAVRQAYLEKPFTREKLLAAAGVLLHLPAKFAPSPVVSTPALKEATLA